jgi:hypothetical protein
VREHESLIYIIFKMFNLFNGLRCSKNEKSGVHQLKMRRVENDEIK